AVARQHAPDPAVSEWLRGAQRRAHSCTNEGARATLVRRRSAITTSSAHGSLERGAATQPQPGAPPSSCCAPLLDDPLLLVLSPFGPPELSPPTSQKSGPGGST